MDDKGGRDTHITENQQGKLPDHPVLESDHEVLLRERLGHVIPAISGNTSEDDADFFAGEKALSRE